VEYLPLYAGSKGEVMAQFTMEKIEQLGLIKFDFPGAENLDGDQRGLRLIEKPLNMRIDLGKISLNDAASYQLCSDGKTTGVFPVGKLRYERPF